jgi:ATP/maltotriose-dependent transcriptional regulator MalT/DNA-binding SARP family transcriptional activator
MDVLGPPGHHAAMGKTPKARKKAATRPVVLAKVRAPRLTAVIPRARLFGRLDADLRRRRLVWITAPAGAGKTTLAAGYARARALEPLWFQFAARDADPATFFFYLREAAAQVAPRARRLLPLLTPEYAFGLATYTRNFFEQLGALLPAPCLLVLDNHHELPADAPLHALLADGLDALPESARVLVLSRDDPPPAFAGWRAARRLAIVDAGQLALTVSETRALARRYRFTRLKPDVIANLHARTRGWTAGAILLLEEAAQAPLPPPSFEQPLTLTMFSYFAAEVLQRAPQAQQKVLLVTALLTQVSTEMARRLTGEEQAGRVLAELARKGFFVTVLGGREPVYQYHPLFREFLLEHGRAHFAGAERRALVQQAAALLAASGQVDEAAELLREAGDEASLVALIEEHAPTHAAQGRLATVEGWLRSLAPSTLEARPWLSFWLGACRMPFDLRAARAHLERAYAGFKQADLPLGLYLAWAGVVDTYHYEWNDYTPLDRWIEEIKALRLAHPLDECPQIAPRVIYTALHTLGAVRPDDPELSYWVARAQVSLDTLHGHVSYVPVATALLLHYGWVGDLKRLRQLAPDLARSVSAPEVEPLARLFGYLALSQSGWMVGDLDAARTWIERAREFAARQGIRFLDSLFDAQAVLICQLSGDVDGAAGYIARIGEAARPERRLDVAHHCHHASWLAFERGEYDEARALMEKALAINEALGSRFPAALCRVYLAEVLVEFGELALALHHLDGAAEFAQRMGSRFLACTVDLIRAWVLLRAGRNEECAVALARCLELGRRQGFTTFPNFRATQVAQLCAFALERDLEPDHVRRLIALRGLRPPAGGYLGEQWPWRLRIHTLGRFALSREGRPVTFEGRTQRRALDLLKALVAHGGRGVSEQRLCDSLWPDAEADDARASLKVTLHRLRGLVGHEAIVVSESRLSLDEAVVWVDVWGFERAAERLATARALTAEDHEVIGAQLLALYRGPFLGDDDAGFALLARERLRGKWMRAIATVAGRLQEDGSHERALAWYEHGLEVEPLAEPFYQGLMRVLQTLHRPADGLGVYQRCRRLLRAALHVNPSPETESLAAALRGSSSAT